MEFTVIGVVSGAVNASVALELYTNKVADASLAGEGETFLQEVTVTTDASGNFTAVFSKVPPAKVFLSFTARVSSGTSAFSTDFVV